MDQERSSNDEFTMEMIFEADQRYIKGQTVFKEENLSKKVVGLLLLLLSF